MAANILEYGDCPTAPSARDYRSCVNPVWCPGCGDFGVLGALTRAFAQLALAPENVACISGIGCSSRLPTYTGVYGFHGVHGRALPLATGLSLGRPDLTVIAMGGDGDGFSIGGNHFLHACRRNADLTYIVMDNAVYGMTKGQASPTTAADWDGSGLTPEGPDIAPLQPLELALSAGAGFIARGFSADPKTLVRLLTEAIDYPGFAFIQVLSPCPTYRPEQVHYKKRVHDGFRTTSDRRDAFAQLMDDDDFTTGLLYRREMGAYTPRRADPVSLNDLSAQFLVTPPRQE